MAPHKTLAALALVAMASCAPHYSIIEAQHAHRLELADKLDAARRQSTYTCRNRDECDIAFSTVKLYIRDVSDVRITVSDDTIVETYNPTARGEIGMAATRTPRPNGAAQIDVAASCYDGNAITDRYFDLCAPRLLAVLKGIKPAIELGIKGATP